MNKELILQCLSDEYGILCQPYDLGVNTLVLELFNPDPMLFYISYDPEKRKCSIVMCVNIKESVPSERLQRINEAIDLLKDNMNEKVNFSILYNSLNARIRLEISMPPDTIEERFCDLIASTIARMRKYVVEEALPYYFKLFDYAIENDDELLNQLNRMIQHDMQSFWEKRPSPDYDIMEELARTDHIENWLQKKDILEDVDFKNTIENLKQYSSDKKYNRIIKLRSRIIKLQQKLHIGSQSNKKK